MKSLLVLCGTAGKRLDTHQAHTKYYFVKPHQRGWVTPQCRSLIGNGSKAKLPLSSMTPTLAPSSSIMAMVCFRIRGLLRIKYNFQPLSFSLLYVLNCSSLKNRKQLRGIGSLSLRLSKTATLIISFSVIMTKFISLFFHSKKTILTGGLIITMSLTGG